MKRKMDDCSSIDNHSTVGMQTLPRDIAAILTG